MLYGIGTFPRGKPRVIPGERNKTPGLGKILNLRNKIPRVRILVSPGEEEFLKLTIEILTVRI
jgi:hypothetical protein